jgi:hypothetical protein
MGRVACPFNHSPMPNANFPDLNPNLRPSINSFTTSCSGYNKSDFSTSSTQIGDDPNEYNLKCLPAVTVCKGVVSKTHGTFVCEFTTPSELAPPCNA